MKKEELLDAIGDIDDKYVTEAEVYRQSDTDKKKIRKFRRWVPVAAGLGVLVIGGFVWSMQDNFRADKTSDATAEESAGATAGGADEGSAAEGSAAEDPVSGEAADKNQNSVESASIDYREIFKSYADPIAEMDYTLESGGPCYAFESAQSMPELPFDTSIYTEQSMQVYCKEDGAKENINMNLYDPNVEKYLNITVSESGNFFSCYEQDLGEGVDRFGTMVYGFDNSAYSDAISLDVYFTREDGAAYHMSSSGLDYAELGTIMDGVIREGIDPETFDYTKSVKKEAQNSTISIADANKKSAFAGEIPDVMKVSDMTFEEAGSNYFISYENDQVSNEEYDVYYSNPDLDYITLSYVTDQSLYHEEIPREQLTKEAVAAYANDGDSAGNSWYSFAISCEKYDIGVTASCTEEELWEYLSQLP